MQIRCRATLPHSAKDNKVSIKTSLSPFEAWQMPLKARNSRIRCVYFVYVICTFLRRRVKLIYLQGCQPRTSSNMENMTSPASNNKAPYRGVLWFNFFNWFEILQTSLIFISLCSRLWSNENRPYHLFGAILTNRPTRLK